jgi:hypothetical protein
MLSVQLPLDNEAAAPRLKFPFIVGGFLHDLLAQEGPVCLVRRTRCLDGSGNVHFEIAVLRPHNARTWPNGECTPAGWHYPGNERWGTDGWTYNELAKARQKYDELCSKMAAVLLDKAKTGGFELSGTS